MLTYNNCKKVINNGTYASYDYMMEVLEVFLLGSRITVAQYNELVALLNEKENR